MSFRGVKEARGSEDSGGQIDMGAWIEGRARGRRRTTEDNGGHAEDHRGQYIRLIVFVPYQLIWGCCWRLSSVGVDCRRLSSIVVDCRRLSSIDMGVLVA